MIFKNKLIDIFSKEGLLEKEKKYFLNRVGEYGTIAKLSRYGIDAYLTHGNKKSFDIVAAGNGKSVKIQVKTTKENAVPTRFFQTYYDLGIETPDYWVLVNSIMDENGQYNEKYYILTHSELMDYHVEQLKRPKEGINNADDLRKREQLLRESRKSKVEAERKASGLDKVFFKEIQKFENQFNKIFNALYGIEKIS
ncbi:hypothetical protein V7124_19725 [Neobacillus niacini]|uniref:hypothetical protein n=1 Tax=Neobacillus niacini TaxID=86668 RepID=UPI002FFEC9A1